ncbi:hypothetical protein NDS46_02745 [Paenibacillus thiaminolyticus]|uniref:hypothetical protein n=1 Tax=Paenibacillus thiaminolyticus TaxID=49283 RepID=UPI00232AEC61|nr:hypothetical protein [Paenibacillus thiaminolyticus]WCF08850.1 hypothetical protein NDS46_02745 [Paenibacillus thiaminolyticus]
MMGRGCRGDGDRTAVTGRPKPELPDPDRFVLTKEEPLGGSLSRDAPSAAILVRSAR